MHKPLLTVYILCKNYSQYVTQSIKSVLNQSYDKIDFIIIDDFSSDDSFQVILKAVGSKNTRIIRNNTTLGLTACCNIALQQAKGEYILRLDADDYLVDEALQNLVSVIRNNHSVGMVYGDYIEITSDGTYIADISSPSQEICVLQGISPHGACTLFKTSVLRNINGYSEEFDRQDGFYIWLKLLDNVPILKCNANIFYYRKHSFSLSSKKILLLQARYRILSHFFSQLNSTHKCAAILLIREHIATYDYSSLKQGNSHTILKYSHLLNCIQSLPSITDAYVYTSLDDGVTAEMRHLFPRVTVIPRYSDISQSFLSLSSFYENHVKHLKSIGYQDDDLILTISDQHINMPKLYIEAMIHKTLVFKHSTTLSVTMTESEVYSHDGVPINNTAISSTRRTRNPLFIHDGGLRAMRLKAFIDALSPTNDNLGFLEIDRSIIH